MIPTDALNKIRSVIIHYNRCILGFSFFDKDGVLLWEIGRIDSEYKKETVLLAENEVIVGVVAKHDPERKAFYDIYYNSIYSDF